MSIQSQELRSASLTRLDNDYEAFLEASKAWGLENSGPGVLEITSPSAGLMRYVDPLKLQGFLDRIAEMRLDPGYREYLESLGFDPRFVKALADATPPTPRVLSKDGNIKVTVTGERWQLPLWEVPVSVSIRDLYYANVAKQQNLNFDVLFNEGLRRFHVKSDMLRNSGLRFVEAGSRYRVAYDWYSFLIASIIGDMGDLLVGTTNLGIAMAFGLRAAHSVEARRVQSPSVKDLESILDEEGRPVVVTGTNAFQMAHLYGHFGDSISFEWDQDLTADMGPAARFLPLSTITTQPPA